MKQKSLLAKLSLAAVGLLAASSLMGAATAPKVSVEADLVKTSKTFDGFKVELTAPLSVDAQQLLEAIPTQLTYSEDAFAKVSAAVDKVRLKAYPDAPISLSVSRLGSKATKTTSNYVSLYTANYWWNRTANLNGQIYGYNYYRNTVVCFVRVQNGSWYGQYQNNGSWSNQGYVYTGGLQTMYVTGYDNYKGCNWWGKSVNNKGDFVIYVFD